MSQSIDLSFAQQFEREVHLTFQNKGGYLRPTVRRKGVVGASRTTMQKIGYGEAVQKARHGKVPPMNVDHTPVPIDIEDWYAKELVDSLDELKVQHDERGALVDTTVFALGRRADRIIMEAVVAGGTDFETEMGGGTGNGITYAGALALLEGMGNNSVPDDGRRYAAVGWHQWAELLKITEFNDADKVSVGALPIPRGTQARMWLGTIWMPVENLPKTGDLRTCIFHHYQAVGLGEQKSASTDVWWDGDMQGYHLTSCMALGSSVIDAKGAFFAAFDDTTALT